MRYSWLLGLLGFVVVSGFVASLVIGVSDLGFVEVLRALFGVQDQSSGQDSTTVNSASINVVNIVVQEIRLPRAILGLAVGITLGLSGAALQGFLRNPLAEPGLIGVSGSAALGAVIAIYTGLSLSFPLALPVVAIAAALFAVFILQMLASGTSVLVLILAGIAISSLTGALTSLVLNLSTNPFAALEIIYWMLGSITDRSMEHLALALPFMLVGWVLLGYSSKYLDALSLGEETATSLGVNVNRLRWLVVTGTGIAVGAATAVSGVIGFVGLVVPHLLRPLVGHHPGRLLPASALGGAALVLSADVLVRMIALEAELKLGVVTALVGAPFFFWLILKTRRGEL